MSDVHIVYCEMYERLLPGHFMVLWVQPLSPSAQHFPWHKKSESHPCPHISTARTCTHTHTHLHTHYMQIHMHIHLAALHCHTVCVCVCVCASASQAVFYVAGHTGVLLDLEGNRQRSLKCHVSWLGQSL